MIEYFVAFYSMNKLIDVTLSRYVLYICRNRRQIDYGLCINEGNFFKSILWLAIEWVINVFTIIYNYIEVSAVSTTLMF